MALVKGEVDLDAQALIERIETERRERPERLRREREEREAQELEAQERKREALAQEYKKFAISIPEYMVRERTSHITLKEALELYRTRTYRSQFDGLPDQFAPYDGWDPQPKNPPDWLDDVMRHVPHLVATPVYGVETCWCCCWSFEDRIFRRVNISIRSAGTIEAQLTPWDAPPVGEPEVAPVGAPPAYDESTALIDDTEE